MDNLRAEFFGLDPSPKGNKTELDLLNMNFNDNFGGSKRKSRPDDLLSGDSDISSDERGFEGTFSPGEPNDNEGVTQK